MISIQVIIFNRVYFGESPVYDENDFKRLFRIPYEIFELLSGNITVSGIFLPRRDATGKSIISPRMPIAAALLVLAFGNSLHEMDEECDMSHNRARQSFFWLY